MKIDSSGKNALARFFFFAHTRAHCYVRKSMPAQPPIDPYTYAYTISIDKGSSMDGYGIHLTEGKGTNNDETLSFTFAVGPSHFYVVIK